MSTISTGVGLISGLDIAGIVDALINAQRQQVDRLEQRSQSIQAVNTGLKSLEANLLTLTTSVQKLGETTSFDVFTTTTSESGKLEVTTTPESTPGTYLLRPVRTSATHQVRSAGFASQDATPGAGTLVISRGGHLDRDVELGILNAGSGVRRGILQITDRSGATAQIDLSTAYTVNDVLDAINGAQGVAVEAHAEGERLVITDTSGQTASDLIVADVGGGHVAQDLGLAKSSSTGRIDGDDIFQLSGAFTLSLLNDGNSIHRVDAAPDIRITLTDDSTLEINLDDALTLDDVIAAINDDANNNGRVTAALIDGRLQLTDSTGGGGTSALAVEDINGAAVVEALGLNTSAAGNVLTGKRLVAGLGSVLLRNLRGGAGVTETGQLSLTDRTGTTAVVDLSTAESLDEVINAINAATAADGTKLQLQATLDEAGTGIEVRDLSGATASNLIIADVGTATLAADLGIAVDDAVDSVASGSLSLRYVNQSTSLAEFAPDGGPVDLASFRITDSAGNSAVITLSEAVKTLGDVLQRINAAQGISVRAELNSTGDGFVLIDEAGGTDPLRVEEVDGTTAADLRILGDGVAGADGKSRITSRQAAVIDLDADTTLVDLMAQLNTFSGLLSAQLVDDGSGVNPTRLVITSAVSGADGRLVIDDGGLGLGLATVVEGRDALLQVGDDPDTAFLLASETDTFRKAVAGLDVDVLASSAETVQVDVERDFDAIRDVVRGFVDGFNAFLSMADDLTRFDPETNERGVLQGEPIVLRARSRLENIVHGSFFGQQAPFRRLAELGISTSASGKLQLDEDRLTEVLGENPKAVADFFTSEDGFAEKLTDALEALTDPFTGSFKVEEDALQASVDSLAERIDQLEQILAVRRDRLSREFFAMETALGQLATQQQALSAIGTLRVAPAATGLLGLR